MIQDGKLDPYVMLSHRVAVEEMDVLYQKFNKYEDHLQKVYVQTKFSDPPAPGTPPLKSLKA